MSENDSSTPFGPGFVAATIVVAAVVLCGIVLLVAGNGPAVASQEPARAPEPTSQPSRAGSCSLPADNQALPGTAPAADEWEVSRRVVVPRSAAFGPGVVDPDGFRRCFAHSPTGAVFAAYNVLAALADQTKVAATARKLLLPGAETDAMLRELAAESPSADSAPPQLAGYRVLAANRDQVTVLLAVPVEAQYMSLTVTMVWHDHDWRLQPPPPGDAVGAPFVQVRSLADFVKWSGL